MPTGRCYLNNYPLHQGAELRDVMEQRGHSKFGLTANTYAHVFLDRKKKLYVDAGGGGC